jgi:hypothetical protein
MAAIRSRLSFANVMSVLAVFIALGGTAAASLIITSNSEVGPNTISGHKPPASMHANIVGGSLNATDLAPGAVTGGKLAPNSVSRGVLNFALGADGVTNTNKISSTGSFQTVAKTTVKVDHTGTVMLINGAVGIDNTTNTKSATVTLRALMNGAPEPGQFTTTVAPGTSGTGLAFMLCDELPGTYTVELQARGSNVSFTDRTLAVELSPQV